MRIIRACRELGIASVAVYSEADRAALHVRLADEAWPIGPAPSRESLPAHRPHPGGGAPQRAPTPSIPATASWPRTRPSRAPARRPASSSSARAARRSRSWARRPRPAALAVEAGVPVVPGTLRAGRRRSPRSRREADAHRLPGHAEGGRRRRRQGPAPRARGRGALAAPPSARAREALSAFGDDRVYLEKALLRPRHIEIQVLADHHGNAVHLFERECSIQRRHQKVIEESPSPFVTPELRERMGALAVALVRAGGLPQRGHARVPGRRGPQPLLPGDEHAPAGRAPGDRDGHRRRPREAADPRSRRASRCPSRRRTCAQRGHAIECRVYAEDPERRASCPARGASPPCARPAGPACATTAASTKAARSRSTTTRCISKLVAWGADRAEAIARMRRARRRVHGARHPHHAALLRPRAAPSRVRGRRLRHRLRGARSWPSRRRAGGERPGGRGGGGRHRAPCASARRARLQRRAAAGGGLAPGARAGWREPAAGPTVIFDATRRRPHACASRCAARRRPLHGASRRPRARGGRRATPGRDSLSLLVDGRSHEVGLERRRGRLHGRCSRGDVVEVELREARRAARPRRARAGRRARAHQAPMPGKLVRVLVAAGRGGGGGPGPGGDGSHEDGERAPRAAGRAGEGGPVRERPGRGDGRPARGAGVSRRPADPPMTRRRLVLPRRARRRRSRAVAAARARVVGARAPGRAAERASSSRR